MYSCICNVCAYVFVCVVEAMGVAMVKPLLWRFVNWLHDRRVSGGCYSGGWVNGRRPLLLTTPHLSVCDLLDMRCVCVLEYFVCGDETRPHRDK